MRTSLLSTMILLFWSCGPSYKILKPKQADNFSLKNYPTYSFFEIDAEGDTIPETFQRNLSVLKTAIKRNLDQRGLKEARDASLKINIGINVREKIQTRQTDFQNDGRPLYMGQRRYSWKSQEVEVGRYREGTLLIDLVDSADSRMVWQGGSEGILPGKTKDYTSRMNEVVDEIFSSLR